jgi:large subunit ribosomal protein L17
MRHQKRGRKLGRDSAHRKSLYANLTSELIQHGRIRTTLAKRGDLHARRQAVAFLRQKTVVKSLFEDVAPRYAERPGGYTRIIKLGPRLGDAAEMAYIELV